MKNHSLCVIAFLVLLGCDSPEPTPEVKVECEHEKFKDIDKTIENLKLANAYLNGWSSGYDSGYSTGYYEGLKAMHEIMENKKKPLVNHPKKNK